MKKNKTDDLTTKKGFIKSIRNTIKEAYEDMKEIQVEVKNSNR